MTNTITVPFYDNELYVVDYNNEPYVPMRPIVEGIGLNWSSQTVKLNKYKEKFSCCDIATAGSDGKLYNMLCMPLRKLNGWLFSINPNKVKVAIRDKLISYQEESFIAIHDYWVKGQATNPRKLSVMEQLNEACADYQRDKAIASKFGTGLNAWKDIKPQHESKLKQLAQQAGELVLDFILVEVGKGKTTRSDK
ncbi:phage antirepressor N-terminal domain-containing protein [Providencia rettgeri]|uniref:phage antirepressor N-terminal domain-containing protein n=1 Tax=Providencia rettgeri TaxID=587 RepID=UPI00300F87EE